MTEVTKPPTSSEISNSGGKDEYSCVMLLTVLSVFLNLGALLSHRSLSFWHMSSASGITDMARESVRADAGLGSSL